jgi:hypothetical protein
MRVFASVGGLVGGVAIVFCGFFICGVGGYFEYKICCKGILLYFHE